MIIAGGTACGIAGRQELDLVGDDVEGVALGTVLRIIGAGLKAAFHRDLAALGQITGAELRSLSPADDVEEIRLQGHGQTVRYLQDVRRGLSEQRGSQGG